MPCAAAGGRIGTTAGWRLGVMLGTVNADYFATNAFMPDFLRARPGDGSAPR